MSRLEIILSSVLLLSIAFNIGVFVYARAAVVRLLWVSDELGDLQSMISSFSEHIRAVYETEMFYGDETLQGVVEHARSLDEQLQTFEYVYSLTEREELIIDDERQTEQDTEAEAPS